MLEQLAGRQGSHIDAILVDVPFEILEKRMTGRRSCPICGEIYNIYFKPPRHDNVCDRHPATQLDRRGDDTLEKIRVRRETYVEQTQPLIDYYERSGRLHRIDGTRDPEVIYSDIEKIINTES